MRKMGTIMLGIFGGLFMLIASVAVADALQSTNYNFKETSLGGLGNLESSSANFKATTSGGILGTDTGVGTIFKIDNGNETTDDPALSFGINSTTINFGQFSPTQATTTTSTFEVRDYTSYGYIVQIFGTAPTNGTHSISAMPSEDVSQVGNEQFGINLVANTSPTSVGANPNHGQFGFGDAATHYNTSNNYRFVSGDIIATSPKSSGTTIYTISYLVNVSALTFGGIYTSNQVLLCTATF